MKSIAFLLSFALAVTLLVLLRRSDSIVAQIMCAYWAILFTIVATIAERAARDEIAMSQKDKGK